MRSSSTSSEANGRLLDGEGCSILFVVSPKVFTCGLEARYSSRVIDGVQPCNIILCTRRILCAIAYNEWHICDVALSRAKGHVAERGAAAPRSPRRPAGAPMYIRAVIRSCAKYI
jgi:hypothetical protein